MPAFAADASGGTGPNGIFDIVREDGGIRDVAGGGFSEVTSTYQDAAIQATNQAMTLMVVSYVGRVVIVIAIIAAVFFLIFRLTKKK